MEDEFSKFADFPYALSVLNGSSSKKIEKLKEISVEGLQVAVINYESVMTIEKR